MRQLNYMQAVELAKKAVENSRPIIGGDNDPLPKGATFKDVLELMERAAFKALQLAGNLDENDRREDAIRDRAVAKAEAQHRAWCKATGSRC